MKQNNLLVNKETKLRAKRGSLRPKPKAKKPNEIWGIDPKGNAETERRTLLDQRVARAEAGRRCA